MKALLLVLIPLQIGSGEVKQVKPKENMADYKQYLDFVKMKEGGFVDNPSDSGRATNFGITIATYKEHGWDNDSDSDIDVDDLKAMTHEQFESIFQIFWRKVKADSIKDQMVGNLVFQFHWGSGYYGRTLVQEVLNRDFGKRLTIDGKIGANTVKAINECDAETLVSVPTLFDFVELKKEVA